MTNQNDISQTSLSNANTNQNRFSGHGNSRGAAGYLDIRTDGLKIDHLGSRGDSLAVTPGAEGFGRIEISASWDVKALKPLGFFQKLLGKKQSKDIDLDLGCLYELQDGHRGAVQALGQTMGHYDEMPFMALSGDERTGKTEGEDETIFINGVHWSKIKRVLVYVYIYKGASDWSQCRPQIQVRIPGQKPMAVNVSLMRDDMDICAIAILENVRNGIRLTNYTEYFPGQAEMDRAFGFGIEWAEGRKS